MTKTLPLLVFLRAFASPSVAEEPLTITVAGTTYFYRWSQGTQHEFTPKGQEDLATWQDMITINVFPEVRNGEQLVQIANAVLSQYQMSGVVVRTDSRPRTESSEAEHLIVAILAGNGVMEAVHARIKLVEGTGTATVWSHRAYGENAADDIGPWLQKHGMAREKTFMAWNGYPKLVELGR